MFAKFAALLHSKAALALLGVLLMGAGGTTAIVSAHGTGMPSQPSHTSASTNSSGNTTNAGSAGNDDRGDLQREAHGTVTSIGAGSFVLKRGDGSSITVAVTAQTQFKDDLHAFSDLKVGAQVEVKGRMQPNGMLAATSIEAQAEPENANNANDDDANDDANNNDAGELHGTVVSVSASAGSFVLKLGDGTTRTVTVSRQTAFEDDASGLSGLKSGAQVEVNGSAQANDAFAATRVEVRGADANDDNGGDTGGDRHGGSGDDSGHDGRGGHDA